MGNKKPALGGLRFPISDLVVLDAVRKRSRGVGDEGTQV